MRKRKILVVASYMNIGVTVTQFKEPTFSNPPTYKIEARPFLDDYKPTKVELEQLPQKIKHRKKRPFHN